MAKHPDFLAHNKGDHVAVAVHDVEPGENLVNFLDGSEQMTVQVTEAVPLSHKVALVDIAEGDDVIEYSLRVAIASKNITKGQYVHTHNVRSARWQNSVA